MSQRRETTARALEQQLTSGVYAPDNMANKIQTKSGSNVDPGSYGEVMRDNKTIRCPDSKDFCYTLWEGDPNDKSKVTIIKQGKTSSSTLLCQSGLSRCTSSEAINIPRTNDEEFILRLHMTLSRGFDSDSCRDISVQGIPFS